MTARKQPRTLAATVRAARERAGLPLRELAARAGIHYSVLSRIESGSVANPTPDTVRRLADALGLEPSELLEFIGVRLPPPRVYFRRAYDLTPEEAQAAEQHIADLIAGLRADHASQKKKGGTP